MYRIALLVSSVLLCSAASAERIKRKPPDGSERARIASDQAMKDGDLRREDIISTDQGFLLFRGWKLDGTYDFAPVPNPFSPYRQSIGNFR